MKGSAALWLIMGAVIIWAAMQGFGGSVVSLPSGETCKLIRGVRGSLCCDVTPEYVGRSSATATVDRYGCIKPTGEMHSIKVTFNPPSGYNFYVRKCKDCDIDCGAWEIVGGTGTAVPHIKEYTVEKGEALQFYATKQEWIGYSRVSYTVDYYYKYEYLGVYEDSVHRGRFSGQSAGCVINPEEYKTLDKNKPLTLDPGGPCYDYIYKYEEVPISSGLNIFEYNGELVWCGSLGAGGKAYYSLDKIDGYGGCYLAVENPIKQVECCPGEDRPGYVCVDGKLKLKSETQEAGECLYTSQCPGGGLWVPNPLKGGNYMVRYRCVNHQCIPEEKQMNCLHYPVDTCPAGYYCDENANDGLGECKKSPDPVKTCDKECCVNEPGYQDKPCPGGHKCCYGVCTTDEKPVCCPKGGIARTLAECTGSVCAWWDIPCQVMNMIKGMMGGVMSGVMGALFFGFLILIAVVVIFLVVPEILRRR